MMLYISYSLVLKSRQYDLLVSNRTISRTVLNINNLYKMNVLKGLKDLISVCLDSPLIKRVLQ